jgi:osmotically-inducible protein OsmY
MTPTHAVVSRSNRPQELPTQKSNEQTADPAAQARQRLSQSPYRELKNVSCGTNEGVLVLRGKVSSFYLKQLAQELVRRTDGVGAIVNQLEVDGLPI